MNREIKFRAWNGKEMRYNININDGKPVRKGYQWFNESNDIHNSEPMQFTGFQDKNNIDIYEGDIIDRRGDDKIVVSTNEKVKSPFYEEGIVEFKEGSFVIKWTHGENSWFGEYPHFNLLKEYYGCSEIIGNIYQPILTIEK